MSNILVTGASGFVGKALVKALISQGIKPRVLLRQNSSKVNLLDYIDNCDMVYGDITDYESLLQALQGIEKVYHTAALVSFQASNHDKLLQVNSVGSRNLVNAMLEVGAKRLLYISSTAALGRNENQTVIDENTEWDASTHNTMYGISKYQGELEAWRGYAEGLEVAIINPAIILGNGAWQFGTGKFFEMAYKEFSWYSSGSNGFVGLDDVVSASILLMESHISGERFILCENNYTYQQIFNTIAMALNKKPPHRALTPFLAGLAWRLAYIYSIISGKEAFITKEIAKNAMSHNAYNGKKIKTAIPFNYTAIENVISKTALHYLDYIK